MFCALLTSRYQVSDYRTNGPLVYKHVICHAGLISSRTSVKAMYGVCILLWGYGGLFPKKTLNCDNLKAIPQM